MRIAESELGLDMEKFEERPRLGRGHRRVRDDMLDAEAMDISAVPTFFVNGRRHTGPFDARTLISALRESSPTTREDDS